MKLTEETISKIDEFVETNGGPGDIESIITHIAGLDEGQQAQAMDRLLIKLASKLAEIDDIKKFYL